MKSLTQTMGQTGQTRNPAPSCCNVQPTPIIARTRTLVPLIALAGAALCAPVARAGYTNNILITGYWPPTNNMVRQFSTSPASNPAGWQGSNWRNSGFNIHSYFPEFPGQTGPNWGRGTGDFEVDYQDTWADWQRITAEIKPVAIITFSRANTTVGWELEPAAQRFRIPGEASPPGRTVPLYSSDGFDNNGAAPPNMTVPTDAEFLAQPVGTIYNNTLPMQQIVSAVDAAFTTAEVDPFIAAYNPATPNTYDFGGSFLSGYISFLGTWYQSRNSSPSAEFRTFAAGHIHVGTSMTLANATLATEITLDTLIAHLRKVMPDPGTTLDPRDLSASNPFNPPAVPAPASALLLACGLLTPARRRVR